MNRRMDGQSQLNRNYLSLLPLHIPRANAILRSPCPLGLVSLKPKSTPVASMEDSEHRLLDTEESTGDIQLTHVEVAVDNSDFVAEGMAVMQGSGGMAPSGMWTPPAYAFGSSTLGTRTRAPPAKRARLGRNFHRSAQWYVRPISHCSWVQSVHMADGKVLRWVLCACTG